MVVERRDIQGALSRATDWVQAEFENGEEVAAGRGCELGLESDPGVALRLDRRSIGRAHPKMRQLALACPIACDPTSRR